MKKYEYVKLEGVGFFAGNIEGHRKIIDEYAAKGYRYVGNIPTYMDAHGRIVEMDLIFEIDTE